ncbi:type IV toxin-antitoxin system AbiEi family antitoxin domain-containing protein [Bifidobacterium felsineum]|uniref:CTP synthase n=1 Tax=Bifidobacterium felsineum TaxID=2045440 RepID=A0A2M9HML8_9BIFI|nr:hypothetical protein [Bifidobacterium felsineum]PJM78060.1 hypothetical protein CSQ86_03275 [Bifidobacterium felsineum]
MKEHKGVSALLQTAEREQRCAIGENEALYRALQRRVRSGELISPYPNVFASASYWTSLTVEEQSLHTIRALSKLHPKWVFAGLSAACIYGYHHSFSLHDGTIHIASSRGSNKNDHAHLNRIYVHNGMRVFLYRNLPVTSPAQTLIDCARLPFDKALAIYDSALRFGHATILDVETLMVQINCDEIAVKKLLQYANPLRENGGESWAYANISKLGFAEPLFQETFDNPDNPSMPYRVDFCWKLADGRIIVAEYDGVAKYIDTSNPNRANVKMKLEYERRRERHLKERGVTTIVHMFYETVADSHTLDATLMDAGVPKIR